MALDVISMAMTSGRRSISLVVKAVAFCAWILLVALISVTTISIVISRKIPAISGRPLICLPIAVGSQIVVPRRSVVLLNSGISGKVQCTMITSHLWRAFQTVGLRVMRIKQTGEIHKIQLVVLTVSWDDIYLLWSFISLTKWHFLLDERFMA